MNSIHIGQLVRHLHCRRWKGVVVGLRGNVATVDWGNGCPPVKVMCVYLKSRGIEA